MEHRAYPKIFEILATLKKIFPFCTLTLRKYPKMHEVTPKIAQFCDDPHNYPQNLHILLNTLISDPRPLPPKKNKNKKNIEIQNFELPKWAKPTYI